MTSQRMNVAECKNNKNKCHKVLVLISAILFVNVFNVVFRSIVNIPDGQIWQVSST